MSSPSPLRRQCPQCFNALRPLSVNKGLGNKANQHRLQQLCSNSYCRYVLFHSEPLDPSLSSAILSTVASDPTLLYDLSNTPQYSAIMDTPSNFNNDASSGLQAFQPSFSQSAPAVSYNVQPELAFVSYNTSQSLSSQSTTTSAQSVSSAANTIPNEGPASFPGTQSHPQPQLLASGRKGILCQDPNCRTKAGTRSAGSQNCSHNLCKSHCQRRALEEWLKKGTRMACSDRGHQRGLDLPPQPSTFPSGSSSNPLPGGLSIDATQQDLAPTPAGSSVTAPNGKSYSMPLTSAWQSVTPGWSESQSQASRERDTQIRIKAQIFEAQRNMKTQIRVLCWIGENVPVIPFSFNVHRFPHFSLGDYAELVDLFGLNVPNSWVETYELDGQISWTLHNRDTVREVKTADTLLYRALPDGIRGHRLEVEKLDGLQEAIDSLSSVSRKAHGKRNSSSRTTEAIAAPFAKVPRLPSPTRDSWTPEPIAQVLGYPSFALDTTGPSDTGHQSSKLKTSSASTLVPSPQRQIKDYPVIGNRVMRNGARLWPTSFSAAAVIETFERVEDLTARGGQNQQDAFNAVVGLGYTRSTYLHHKKYFVNNDHVMATRRNDHQMAWTDVVAAIDEASGVVVVSDSDDEETKPSAADVSSSGSDLVALCAFCDQALPPYPSLELIAETERLFKLSTPDPIAENPGHRVIRPCTLAAEYCRRHMVERTELPRAVLQNWPTTVNWKGFVDRIHSYSEVIIEMTMEPIDQDSSIYLRYLGGLIFKHKSSAHVFGSAGRFEFGRTYGKGAGYYGEQGWELVMKTIEVLVPLQDHQQFSIEFSKPRTASSSKEQSEVRDEKPSTLVVDVPYFSYLTFVLVPEIVSLLVQGDRHCSPEEADEVLRDSWLYGESMFPVNDLEEKLDEEIDSKKAQEVKDGSSVAPTAGSSGMQLYPWINV